MKDALVSVPTTPDAEAHTPPMLLWTESLSYLMAATKLGKYRTPRLYLAVHGIELGMKSYLRAKGYSLGRLRKLGHSLTRILAACIEEGILIPSSDNRDRLEWLSAVHERQEFRYAHLDHPPHMDDSDWIRVALWALRAALPAVAEVTESTDSTALRRAMFARTDALRCAVEGFTLAPE